MGVIASKNSDRCKWSFPECKLVMGTQVYDFPCIISQVTYCITKKAGHSSRIRLNAFEFCDLSYLSVNLSPPYHRMGIIVCNNSDRCKCTFSRHKLVYRVQFQLHPVPQVSSVLHKFTIRYTLAIGSGSWVANLRCAGRILIIAWIRNFQEGI